MKYITQAFFISVFVFAASVAAFTMFTRQVEAQSFCYTFNTDLKLGSSGVDIDALHTILNREGFTRSSNWSTITPTNTFNEETASLVSGLQEKYRSDILSPLGYRYGTGIVGAQTRTKLNALYSCSTGNGGQAPVVSGIQAPTSLRTNETGTWTVTAYDPQNSALTYYVQWGDEQYYNSGYNLVSPASSGYWNSQQTTFTHAYANPGTYVVRFKVRDIQGYETESSATVTVSYNGGTTDTSGISITTTPNKSVYRTYEDINFTITARNTTAYERVLNFNNGCQTSYRIGTYDSSANQICTMALTSVRVPAYGSYTWNVIHYQNTQRLSTGTYTLTGRVPGFGESSTTVTITDPNGNTGGGNQTNDIRLISPNGGQVFRSGSTQLISWTMPYVQYFAAQSVDIKLIPANNYPLPTYVNTNSTCPIGSTCAYTGNTGNTIYQSQSLPYYQGETYTIARGVYGTSYNWNVGNTASYWSSVPAGAYYMEICFAGTNSCDRSDSTINIY
jgi:hypothetical protein